MDFYAFLPSNASPNIYPHNTTSHFKTQLAQRKDLHGNWRAALIELHYPNTIAQVIEGENVISIFKGNTIDMVYVPPGCYNSILEFLNAVRNALSESEFGARDGQFLQITNDNRLRFIPFDLADEAKVHFSPRLALQLGLEHAGPYPANRENMTFKPIDLRLGMPAQMFVYMDILSDQIIGHTRAPLLRTVPVDMQAKYGGATVVHFDHPIYFDLRTKSFDSIQIDIRDHAGRYIPFNFGTSTLLVHFRQF